MNKRLINALGYFKYKIRILLKPEDEKAANRVNIIFSNYSLNSINNLVGGNFFTGFLILMQADDAFIGIVTMMAIAGNLAQVFSPLLMERLKKRRNILIAARCTIYFLNIIIIGIIPYLKFTNGPKLTILLMVTLLINLINAISSPGFSVWHLKSIPESIRAKFFSFYGISCSIVTYAIILGASRIVDVFKASGNEMEGLMILRVIAVIICLIDIYFLFRIKEYPNLKDKDEVNLLNIFIKPLREKKYLITVAIACLWGFSASIPGPYYNFYLLKDIKVDYAYLTLISLLYIPAQIVFTPLWAKWIRATSWFKILYIAMGMFLINYIGLAFVTRDTLFIYLISVVYGFVFAAAINLVFSNIAFINLPVGNQTIYIGFFSTVYNLSCLTGVFFGKEFIKYTEGLKFELMGVSMQNKQYILLLTAFVMVFAVMLVYFLQRGIKTNEDTNC